MKVILNIFLLLFCLTTYSQTITYSYIDPCTGVVKKLEMLGDQVTVTYYNQVKSFSRDEIQSGQFDAWANSIYSQYGQNSPCGTAIGLTSAINITQNSAINVIGILNSISAISDLQAANSMAGGSGMVDVTVGLSSSSNSSNKKEEKKNNQTNSNEPSNSNSEVNSNSTQQTEPQQSSAQNSSGTNNESNSNGTTTDNNNQTNQGNTQSNSGNNQSEGTSNSSTPVNPSTNVQGGNSGAANQSTQSGSNQTQSSVTDNQNTTTQGNTQTTDNTNINDQTVNNQTNNGQANNEQNSNGTGSDTQYNASGSDNKSNTTPEQTPDANSTEKKSTNILGGAVSSVANASGKSEGNKPTVVLSSDFTGFNFKNNEVVYGGKATGGFTSMRWDGQRTHGFLFDYTSLTKGPNVTAFYAFVNKKRIDLFSVTGTASFIGKGSLYGTMAVGQMWTIKKNAKVVYLATTSWGRVFQEKFVGTAFIAGGMYDFKAFKRADIKLMGLFIYAPFVSYYNDIVLKSPYVVMPIVGTNLRITKKFKLNINMGGTYAIKEDVMNFTIMMGTRFAL